MGSLKLGGTTFFNGGNFDSVEVTELVSPLAQRTCSNFKVQLQTDYNGKETEWSLVNASNAEVLSGGPYSSNRIHNVDACLDPGTYTFKISDSYGDGMCCKYGPGFYKLWLEGRKFMKEESFKMKTLIPLPFLFSLNLNYSVNRMYVQYILIIQII